MAAAEAQKAAYEAQNVLSDVLKASSKAEEEAQMAADEAKTKAQKAADEAKIEALKAADEEIKETQNKADKAQKAAEEMQRAADEAFVNLGFDFDMAVQVTNIGTTTRTNISC